MNTVERSQYGTWSIQRKRVEYEYDGTDGYENKCWHGHAVGCRVKVATHFLTTDHTLMPTTSISVCLSLEIGRRRDSFHGSI